MTLRDLKNISGYKIFETVVEMIQPPLFFILSVLIHVCRPIYTYDSTLPESFWMVYCQSHQPWGPSLIPYSRPSTDPSDPSPPSLYKPRASSLRPQGTGISVWNTQQDHWDPLRARQAELVKAIKALEVCIKTLLSLSG